ncbi:efflux transporter outer membrane subunit [Undibacterium sp. SXout7W]|uniref:efflux transporter outer membrane subunit n=1 Tax=Undibacterium sp. SXout7W TaxID=3413049 RepID=UPI003BF3CAF8
MTPYLSTMPSTRHFARHAIAIGAIAMLSACVSFHGIQSQATMKSLSSEMSAGLYAEQKGQTQQRSKWSENQWPDSQWAQHIGGQDLQDLIDAGLANNPSLQIAAARISAAKALSESVGANELPSVNASLDSTYQRFTENGLIPPPLAGNYKTNNQLALNFSYELDFWGKHRAEMRTALSQEKVAEAEQQSTRLMLSNAIARTWLQLARQYAQLEISNQQLQVREKLDQLTAQRVRAGLETKSEVQQGLIQTSSIKNDMILWQEAIALSRNQLAALLGAGPERGHQIGRPVFSASTQSGVPADLPLELMARRPDIVAARWRVEAVQGEIDVSKTQFYPNINLVGFAGVSSLGLDKLLNTGSTIIGAGPAIRLPIFEGGRLRAQLKSKVASYDAAVATYNQSLTDALREIADQVKTLQSSEVQAQQQQASEAAANAVLQLAQQRQKAGTANVLPVLSAEAALLTQKKISLDIAIRHADSQINLIKALGGGYDRKALATVPTSQTKPISQTSKTMIPASNKSEAK